jgi:hypothetical protein
MDSDLIIKLPDGERDIEVCRSFAYKHNAGNYESRDFFCSAKSTCKASEAEDLSERLYYFCRKQVLNDVAGHIRERHAQDEKRRTA